MRILKYLLLLIILVAIAITVYISTSDGTFSVKKDYTVSLPKSTLFHYVNDYQNWEEWLELSEKEAPSKFTTKHDFVGVGSSLTFSNGKEHGMLKTLSVKENDSIVQKTEWNGIEANSTFIFSEKSNKTIISWECKGKMNFSEKIQSYFMGGIDHYLNQLFDKSLKKLEEKLSKEINTYSIEINGIEKITKSIYLKSEKFANKDEIFSKVVAQLMELKKFSSENNIKTTGVPFIAYKPLDKVNTIIKYYVGIPLKEEIYTSAGSEYTVDSLPNHSALKITLKGDYSHRKEAWNKGFSYIRKNNLDEYTEGIYREVFVKNRTESKFPSQWITEIYIPLRSTGAGIKADYIKPETEQ
ncbi:GyrI-like domain-containing protein [Flavobacterium filum]|uniref:GyrI-like domain-containing protein n=1 Tax=Flavobacterium filum TaxID=370974 RepID=UPI0003FC79E7|nr:GyrI-like domain-containing protein [Flavobacterium filum]